MQGRSGDDVGLAEPHKSGDVGDIEHAVQMDDRLDVFHFRSGAQRFQRSADAFLWHEEFASEGISVCFALVAATAGVGDDDSVVGAVQQGVREFVGGGEAASAAGHVEVDDN